MQIIKSLNPDYPCESCFNVRTPLCSGCTVKEFKGEMTKPSRFITQPEETIKDRGLFNPYARLINDCVSTGNMIPLSAVIEHNKLVEEFTSVRTTWKAIAVEGIQNCEWREKDE